MTEISTKRVEESHSEETAKTYEAALADLQLSNEVTGGTDYKATDITLKRGVVG